MGNAQGRSAAGPVSPVEAAYASAQEMLARNRGVLFEDRYTAVRLLGRGSYAEVSSTATTRHDTTRHGTNPQWPRG